jgi:hypothetical protein
VLHAAPFARPNPGAEPVVAVPSNAVLESIHAPDAGTGTIELLKRYSEAWQRCPPANSVAQIVWAAIRPPIAPL